MIIEESRLQALTSLYSTTKDLFLQSNSHRLWCLVLLVSSLVVLSLLFYLAEGPIRSVMAVAATLVSFSLLIGELHLNRRLSLTRSVLANLEKELACHISDYLGRPVAEGRRKLGRRTGDSAPAAASTVLWPVSLMSTPGIEGSSLASTDSRNWILFIHGLATFAVLVPLGAQVLATGEVDLLSSFMTLTFLLALLVYSIFFVYVVASEQKLSGLVLGKAESSARDQSRKMAWRSVGAIVAVVGPLFCYALLGSKALEMADYLRGAIMGKGSGLGFWVPVALSAGLIMLFVSLFWREAVPHGNLER